MPDLSKLEQEVVVLSREVGHFIAEERRHFDKADIRHKSSFRDLVSYVDKEAEKKIVEALTKMLPDAGVLAEEGSAKASRNGYRWIVDPLDGTTNFYHGLPPYAVSIGLEKDADIVLGVIYEVNQKECFYATRESAAYCNGRSIRVSDATSLKEGLLSTGFPYYRVERQEECLSIMRFFMKHTQGVRRIGSAAVDLAYVACGRLDGFFEYRLNAWDVAAGSLIVQRAGGHVSDFSGTKNFIFGGEICAGGAIHSEMTKIFAQQWSFNKKGKQDF